MIFRKDRCVLVVPSVTYDELIDACFHMIRQTHPVNRRYLLECSIYSRQSLAENTIWTASNLFSATHDLSCRMPNVMCQMRPIGTTYAKTPALLNLWFQAGQGVSIQMPPVTHGGARHARHPQ